MWLRRHRLRKARGLSWASRLDRDARSGLASVGRGHRRRDYVEVGRTFSSNEWYSRFAPLSCSLKEND